MKSGYGPEPVTEGDMAYDVEKVREDFPILQRRVGQYPLAYLDSANTSQKPRQVVEARAAALDLGLLPGRLDLWRLQQRVIER